MQNFSIDYETCSKCGICVEICPVQVIEKNSSDVSFKKDFIHLCLACGQCMAICPTKSIYSKGLDYEKDFFEFSKNNDFFSLIESRRSIRKFIPKAVEKEKIEKILYAISQAPHGDKNQHVEISVINSREKIMEALPLICKFYDDMERWLANPFMHYGLKILIPKDMFNTLKNFILPHIKKGMYRNFSYDYDCITRGAHTLLIFHAPIDSEEHKEDSLIFVTYATIAAHSLGLGSTIIGLIPPAINKIDKLKKIFEIPLKNEVVSSIIFGYPKFEFKRGIKRNLKKIIWI